MNVGRSTVERVLAVVSRRPGLAYDIKTGQKTIPEAQRRPLAGRGSCALPTPGR